MATNAQGNEYECSALIGRSTTGVLVSVAPPYDDAFIAIRRQLAPSAIFTHDRCWIMTERQAARILSKLKEWAVELSNSIAKAEASLDENDREAILELRSLRQRRDSIARVVPSMEKPEPFVAPNDDDEGTEGDPNSSRHRD